MSAVALAVLAGCARASLAELSRCGRPIRAPSFDETPPATPYYPEPAFSPG